MQQQDEDLTNIPTQKITPPTETWESLGLTWLREETDRATEIMLEILRKQHTNKSSSTTP